MVAAAPTTPSPSCPSNPVGMSGEKFSPFRIGKLSTIKAVRAVTLMATSTAFTDALSLVPITSSQVTTAATMMAGRFTTP